MERNSENFSEIDVSQLKYVVAEEGGGERYARQVSKILNCPIYVLLDKAGEDINESKTRTQETRDADITYNSKKVKYEEIATPFEKETLQEIPEGLLIENPNGLFYDEYIQAIEDGRKITTHEEIVNSDVVITHSILSGPALDDMDVPQVMVAHGGARQFSFMFEFVKDRMPPAVRRVLERDIEEIRESTAEILRRADVVVPNSDFVKNQIREYFGVESDMVVYPPVDMSYFAEKDYDEDYYLSVQRIVDHKRVEKQIEAFSDLEEELRIVGEGELSNAVKRLAKPHGNIKVMGRLPEDELIKQYSGANATVQTAIKEDFGYVPVEGFACGTPAIAGHEGGFKETIHSDYLGVTYDPSDRAKNLREAVRNFDPSEYDSERLRKEAEEKYSMSALKPKFEKAVEMAYERVN